MAITWPMPMRRSRPRTIPAMVVDRREKKAEPRTTIAATASGSSGFQVRAAPSSAAVGRCSRHDSSASSCSVSASLGRAGSAAHSARRPASSGRDTRRRTSVARCPRHSAGRAPAAGVGSSRAARRSAGPVSRTRPALTRGLTRLDESAARPSSLAAPEMPTPGRAAARRSGSAGRRAAAGRAAAAGAAGSAAGPRRAHRPALRGGSPAPCPRHWLYSRADRSEARSGRAKGCTRSNEVTWRTRKGGDLESAHVPQMPYCLNCQCFGQEARMRGAGRPDSRCFP